MVMNLNTNNMNTKNTILIFVLLLCTAIAKAQYQQVNDILYTESTDSYAQERCKLDVYYPTNRKDVPVVVMAVYLGWKWLYDFNHGFFNYVIKLLGGTSVKFLDASTMVTPSLALIAVWTTLRRKSWEKSSCILTG